VQLSNNASLTNLDGLSALASVGSFSGVSLVLDRNEALVSVKGLRSLKSLPGRLAISDCNALPNLDGLDSLTRINGSYLLCAMHLLQILMLCLTYPLLSPQEKQ